MRMKTPVNLTLEPALVERARLAASGDGLSLSAWVSALISSALRRSPAPVPPPASAPVPSSSGSVAARGASPVSRNAPCPCGSGLKFKRCCGA